MFIFRIISHVFVSADDVRTTTTKLNDQPNALTPEVAFILGGAVSFIVVAVLLTIGLILRCHHMTKLLLAQKRKQADIQQEDDTNIGMLPIVEIRPPEETELLPHLAYDRNNIYLEKEIGNSSFGQVFISSLNPPLGNFDTGVVRALDKDKPVEMQADFMRQAKILSSLSHPNIIQLLGVCFNGFPYFIIVEYMIHCDLHGYLQKHTSMHHINRNGRFIRQQLSIADQIVLAMEYLGSRRFVHRDLAAHNVFVTEGSDGQNRRKTVGLRPDRRTCTRRRLFHRLSTGLYLFGPLDGTGSSQKTNFQLSIGRLVVRCRAVGDILIR